TIKKGGIQIILVSSRKEHLRDATIDNLVDACYYGWKTLYLRCKEGVDSKWIPYFGDIGRPMEQYKMCPQLLGYSSSPILFALLLELKTRTPTFSTLCK
ncbi:haloacid dehalogenase superfamily, subfamily IIIB acid phosphatase, partial [Tanacetum coccineum]